MPQRTKIRVSEAGWRRDKWTRSFDASAPLVAGAGAVSQIRADFAQRQAGGNRHPLDARPARRGARFAG